MYADLPPVEHHCNIDYVSHYEKQANFDKYILPIIEQIEALQAEDPEKNQAYIFHLIRYKNYLIEKYKLQDYIYDERPSGY